MGGHYTIERVDYTAHGAQVTIEADCPWVLYAAATDGNVTLRLAGAQEWLLLEPGRVRALPCNVPRYEGRQTVNYDLAPVGVPLVFLLTSA